MVPYPSSFNDYLTRILLGPNYSQGYTHGALVSIIEGYWSTRFIFIIGFNMYNIYELLYGALIYGKSYIFPNLGNLLGVSLLILVFICFLIEI